VATWNADLIANAAATVFGAMLLTPPILRAKFNGSFPSRDAMLAAGTRVIIESNDYVGNDYNKTTLPNFIFWPTTWTDQIGALDVAPFPNCTIRGSSTWYGRGLPRLLDSGDLQFDAESGDKEHGIVLKPAGVADLAGCAINNVGLADVTPAALTGWVWSWAAGEPAVPAGGGCAAAAMLLVRGAWRARACGEPLRALCRAGDNRLPAGDRPDLWRMSAAAVAFADAPAACAALGAGWAFDVPRDGRENALVAAALRDDGGWTRGGASAGLWLNVKTA
jgi:hypothetical protein